MMQIEAIIWIHVKSQIQNLQKLQMLTWGPLRQIPFNKIIFFIEDFTKFFNYDIKKPFTPHFVGRR